MEYEATSVVFAGMMLDESRTVVGRQLYPVYEAETVWQVRASQEGISLASCDVRARPGKPVPDATGQGMSSSASWELLTAGGTDDEESIIIPMPHIDIYNPAGRYHELARQAELWLGRGGMTIVVCESAGSLLRRMAKDEVA